MDANDLLLDAYDRLPELVRTAVADVDADDLCWAPAPGANTIGWLCWHLSRGVDAQIAEQIGAEQLWTTGDFARRFGLEPDPADHGYGHRPDEVAAVRPENAQAILDYFDAVHARTRDFLHGLKDDDLDRIVDENWDPPVTLGVRLISILDDAVQHAGQAAYVRGLVRA